MGEGIVLLALGAAVFFAIRSLWRSHKSGKSCCSGDCTHCRGCH